MRRKAFPLREERVDRFFPVNFAHRIGLEHGEDLLARGIRALDDVEFFRQIAERLEEVGDVGEEHDDDAVRERGVSDHLRAEKDDAGNGGPAEKIDERPEHGVDHDLLDIGVVYVVVDRPESAELQRLAAENLDDAHAA